MPVRFRARLQLRTIRSFRVILAARPPPTVKLAGRDDESKLRRKGVVSFLCRPGFYGTLRRIRYSARMVKLVYTRDLKSLGPLKGHAGSSPAPGTIFPIL